MAWLRRPAFEARPDKRPAVRRVATRSIARGPTTRQVNGRSVQPRSSRDQSPVGTSEACTDLFGRPTLMYDAVDASHQDIAFCSSADGTRIATAACGSGPVILRAAHWLSHVTYDLTARSGGRGSRLFRVRHRYVRYDPRGCGMSERHCRRPITGRLAPGSRGGRRDDPRRPVRTARRLPRRSAGDRLCGPPSRARLAPRPFQRLCAGRPGPLPQRRRTSGG